MGEPRTPAPVAPVCALTYRSPSVRDLAAARLSGRLGRVAAACEPYAFDHTRYYEKEMGSPLFKQILVFEDSVDAGSLPDLKHFTNALELDLAENGRRRVNCDAGYLAPARLVLASTKDFAHRLYLGLGIYGEVTLLYQGGTFTPLPWTYPDFREKACLDFLNGARRWYLEGGRSAPRED